MKEPRNISSVVSRRDFICGAGASAALIGARTAEAADGAAALPSPSRIIDTNVTLGQWPLRRLRYDTTAALTEKLRSCGVTEAWAGSFEALLSKNPSESNGRLAEACRRDGGRILRPFGSVNPMIPGWEWQLSECAHGYLMQGIRLFPNYHGYKLDNPQFARLLARAAELKLIVQIAVQMEDERMMHPLLRVEPVDTGPLAEIVKQTPGARVVLLNALGKLRAEPLTKLLAAGEVCVEIATLEGVGGIERLLESVPESKVLFGSHAPLFTFESAALKLMESALEGKRLAAISSGNARRVMGDFSKVWTGIFE